MKRLCIVNHLKGSQLKTGKFEIYKDKAGEYRFRLNVPNGEVIAVSESHSSKNSA